MKKFFKKSKNIKRIYLLELAGLCAAAALLLAAAVFIGSGGVARVSHSIAVNGISPRSLTASVFPCSWGGSCPTAPDSWYYAFGPDATITQGQSATINYQAYACSGTTGACQGMCTLSSRSPTYTLGLERTAGQICDINPNAGDTTYVSGIVLNDPNSGAAYPYTVSPSVTTTYYFCSAALDAQKSTTCIPATITVQPPPASCPASSFGSPWNTNSYLIYSGGQGTISNWYGRYCVHNYSASAIFVPMATPTEWNNFKASAPSLNVGISAY